MAKKKAVKKKSKPVKKKTIPDDAEGIPMDEIEDLITSAVAEPSVVESAQSHPEQVVGDSRNPIVYPVWMEDDLKNVLSLLPPEKLGAEGLNVLLVQVLRKLMTIETNIHQLQSTMNDLWNEYEEDDSTSSVEATVTSVGNGTVSFA